MEEDFLEIESFVRLYKTEKLLQYGNERFEIKNVFYSDSTLWQVFDFELLRGSASDALKSPGAIVLSKSVADRLFGVEDPLGKQILVDNKWTGEITGVVADPPSRSHIQYQAFISMTTADEHLPPDLWLDWFWTEGYTYLALNPEVDVAQMSARFPEFQENHMGAAGRESSMHYEIFLEPLSDIYLHSRSAIPSGPTGSADRVVMFLSIGVLILLLAGFNFTNLATAGSISRAREIGVRKVVGAQSRQLTGQFLMESVVTCLISFVLALLVAGFSLSFFSILSGKELTMSPLWSANVMGYTVVGVVLVSTIAGFFPSFVLSRTPSISVLKGVLPALGTGKRLRHTLVVVQFAVAIVLVAGTFTVRQQLAFVSNASLGITEEEILVIDTSPDEKIQRSTPRIKQAFLADPSVMNITASSDAPGTNRNSSRTVIEDEEGEMDVNYSKLYFVDEDFAPTFELEFVAGRNFSRDLPTDSTSAMIINERAAMVFAYDTPEDAIGKRYRQWGTQGVIVGVFKDFNFTSLHDIIRPLSMRIDPSENRYLSLQLNTAGLAATMERLEAIWSEQVPYRPLSYRFLDDRLDALYTAEQRFSGLVSVFSFLAILIGCLGLFGLASLISDQRSKEIGIRKAMGASVRDIVLLLSRETTALITVSFFVAAPIVWIYGTQWLNNFAYRIELPWMTILLSGVMALAIAWLTIGHSSLSAARANPVDTLRSE